MCDELRAICREPYRRNHNVAMQLDRAPVIESQKITSPACKVGISLSGDVSIGFYSTAKKNDATHYSINWTIRQ